MCFWEYGNDYYEQTGQWTIYVDIISGNPDLIDCVGFRFRLSSETYTMYGQFPTILNNGKTVHRFLLFRNNNNTYPMYDQRISILVIKKSGRLTIRRVFN